MIIVGKPGCPACAAACDEATEPYTYVEVDALLGGKHEHSEDFVVALAIADLAPVGLQLPVLLDDKWNKVMSVRTEIRKW